jgi:Tol biopolymer transport system component
MTDHTKLIERLGERYGVPDLSTDQLLNRRDRKRRNQRIAAGVVGIAVFVAAIWIVTSVSPLDRSETSVGPAGDVTGPAVETGPAETGPAETGPAETGPKQGIAALPVTATDYLVDLETGASTPLPESIVGTEDVTSDYAVSPDGSRLTYVRRGDDGGVQIFVANLDGSGIEQVTVELRGEAMPSTEAAPAWSPDGSKIAYIGRRMSGAHGNVYLLDLATGMSTRVTDDPRDGAQSPTFSPDGSSIVYSAHRKGGDQILAVPVAGGASVPLMGGDAVNAATRTPVEFSPDGSLLSYSCGDEYGSDLCLANADGTDARVLVAGGDGPGSWSPDGTRIAYSDWQSGVNVVDVATGEVTLVSGGALPTWVDDHTLIVEADGCSLPSHKSCPF